MRPDIRLTGQKVPRLVGIELAFKSLTASELPKPRADFGEQEVWVNGWGSRVYEPEDYTRYRYAQKRGRLISVGL